MSGILRYLGCYSGATEADSAGTDVHLRVDYLLQGLECDSENAD